MECHLRYGGVSVQVCILRDSCLQKPDVDSETDGSYVTNAAHINMKFPWTMLLEISVDAGSHICSNSEAEHIMGAKVRYFFSF